MRLDLSRLGMWPLVFVVDAPTGGYIWLHRQLVASPGVGGWPFGVLAAIAAGLVAVNALVFPLGCLWRLRPWVLLADVAVLAWFALSGWHALSGPQHTFLASAALGTAVTACIGGAEAIFWLAPLFERSGAAVRGGR
jgi:hypothetical protein